MIARGKQGTICRYCLLLFLFFGLCYLFPYTGDDWAWGSTIGTQRLSNWFDNYSGRYLGNLIVLVLTRNRLLRAAVMALVFSGIVYCVEKILKTDRAFFFAALSLLLVPKPVLRQAVVWTSGFSNYSTSILLVLVFLTYLSKHYSPVIGQKPRAICLAGLLLLGFCNSLIVEHVTVFNVILGASIVAFWIKQYRRIPLDYVFYSGGAVLGACLMFSNSVYLSISKGSDGYRKIAGGGILYRALGNYFHEIYREGYKNNTFIITVFFSSVSFSSGSSYYQVITSECVLLEQSVSK